MERLNDRMIERLRQEADVQRRSLIYGFPQQMATLRAVAGDFLGEIFRPSRLQEAPLLRGVYFTSGTQDGTPIDRRSEEHTSELQSLMRISYAVFCLKKK